MKNNKSWLVVFSNYWSNSYVYGIGNIVKEFHKDGFAVLWINSIPTRNPSVKRSGSKKTLFKLIFRKLKKHIKPISKQDEKFFIFSPIYIPFPEINFVHWINKFFMRIQVFIALFMFGVTEDYIVMSSSMTNIEYIFKGKEYSSYVHYIADLYSDYRNVKEKTKTRLKILEESLFNFADLLLVSSYNVVEKVERIVKNHEKIIYFPHGVDFNHFHRAYLDKDKYSHLLKYEKPIAGYFGSLTMANDKDVIRRLGNIGFSVVLIGAVKGDYSKLREQPNIHFLGEIEYKDLPKYACNFDIAFMAWKDSEWIRNSNPKKTYEYLALGLPVVSMVIPQVKKELSDIIYFAENTDEFEEKAIKAYEENSMKKIRERIIKAKKSDWSIKYQKLKRLLE